MNSIPIPDYATPATRAAIEAANTRIHEAATALSAAQRAADEARQADVLTADVAAVLASGNALRRARVEHLRAEIAIRQSLDPVFDAIAADHRAALVAAEEDLMHARRHVEQGLTELGLSQLLAYRDLLGNEPFKAIVLQSQSVAPAHRRLLELKLDTTATFQRGQNRLALQTAMTKLRQEFEQAANANGGPPPAKSRRVQDEVAEWQTA